MTDPIKIDQIIVEGRNKTSITLVSNGPKPIRLKILGSCPQDIVLEPEESLTVVFMPKKRRKKT